MPNWKKVAVSGSSPAFNSITGNSFVKIGGTSTQFLKADGSIDSSTYLTSVATSTLQQVTTAGNTTTTSITSAGIISGSAIKSACFCLFNPGTSSPSILFDNNGSANGIAKITAGSSGGGSGGSLNFCTTISPATSPAAHMNLRNGNLGIGIGTGNPAGKLDVRGNITSSGYVKASCFIGDGRSITNVTGSLNIVGHSGTSQTGTAINVTNTQKITFVGNAVTSISPSNPGTVSININTGSAVTTLYESGTGTDSIKPIAQNNTTSGGCSVIAGGKNNTTSGTYSMIAGGTGNTITGATNGNLGFIGGGIQNHTEFSGTVSGTYNSGSGPCSVIAGGKCNETTILGSTSVIGGGCLNYINKTYTSILGGLRNSGSGDCSVIGGGQDNVITKKWSGILGGTSNCLKNKESFIIGSNLTSSADCTTFVNCLDISGSLGLKIDGVVSPASPFKYGSGTCSVQPINGGSATGNCSAIGGGVSNSATQCSATVAGGKSNLASACYSSIGGGKSNEIQVGGKCSNIGGGELNKIMAGGVNAGYLNKGGSQSTIGGGRSNCIQVTFGSTIGGGSYNNISGSESGAYNQYNFIGAGFGNNLNGQRSTIVAGMGNRINRGTGTFVGAGYGNINNGSYSFIGSGRYNRIVNPACAIGSVSLFPPPYSFIGAGKYNSICACLGNGGIIGGGTYNKICNTNNATSVKCSGILGGTTNVVCHEKSFIVGSNITSTAICTTFMNNGVVACHLQVGGTTVMNTTTGRIDASNDVVAFATSDKRLKENIKPISNALCKLSEVSGNTFNWKKLSKDQIQNIHGNKGKDVGVIAQEIESILPEAVTTRDSGYKAVNYEKIIPLLIEAIKDQQKQIDELKSRI